MVVVVVVVIIIIVITWWFEWIPTIMMPRIQMTQKIPPRIPLLLLLLYQPPPPQQWWWQCCYRVLLFVVVTVVIIIVAQIVRVFLLLLFGSNSTGSSNCSVLLRNHGRTNNNYNNHHSYNNHSYNNHHCNQRDSETTTTTTMTNHSSCQTQLILVVVTLFQILLLPQPQPPATTPIPHRSYHYGPIGFVTSYSIKNSNNYYYHHHNNFCCGRLYNGFSTAAATLLYPQQRRQRQLSPQQQQHHHQQQRMMLSMTARTTKPTTASQPQPQHRSSRYPRPPPAPPMVTSNSSSSSLKQPSSIVRNIKRNNPRNSSGSNGTSSINATATNSTTTTTNATTKTNNTGIIFNDTNHKTNSRSTKTSVLRSTTSTRTASIVAAMPSPPPQQQSSLSPRRDNTDFRSKIRIIQQQQRLMLNTATTTQQQRQQGTEVVSPPPSPIIPIFTQSYFDYLFAECVAHDEWDLALVDVVTIMEQQQQPVLLQIQYSTYNACLQACFQNGNANSAIRILQRMEEEDEDKESAAVRPQISDYTLVLLTMCRNYNNNNDHHQTSRTDSISGSTSNNNNNNWCHRAIQLLNDIQTTAKTAHLPDVPITVYDAILSCLIQNREWKMALQILQRMEDDDLRNTAAAAAASTTTTDVVSMNNMTKPELSTYRIVIECCVAANQGDVAYRVLKSYLQKIYQQQQQNRPSTSTTTPSSTILPMPTSYLFEMVIVTLSKSTQQWRRTVQLLDTMVEWNVPRTLTIYNSILVACSKAREPMMAKSILQRMKRPVASGHPNNNKNKNNDIAPNIFSYNTAMAACCSASASTNLWRDALTIFDQIQREPGVTPDICTYTNAIRACVKGGKTERAKSLIQVVKAKGLPLDSYFYTAAIEASSWFDAVTLLREMEANGIPPTEVSYSVTIKACGKSGQWEKALDLLDVMRTKRMKINIYVYNAAIGALAKVAKQRMKNNECSGTSMSMEVMSILSKMRSDGIEPDGFSYSSAISCYGSEGQWEQTLRTIQEMTNGGPNMQPNKVAYTAAISSCGRSGQVDSAIQLFQQMQEQGHTPDTVAYNALFLAYRIANRTDSVLVLWNEMIEKSRSTQTNKTIPYLPSSNRIRPDIITLTEAIGALSSHLEVEPELCHQIDQIILEAVEYGIIFAHRHRGATSIDDNNLYDLSCMSFPVARAACRYVLSKWIPVIHQHQHDIHNNGTSRKINIPDLLFMTGSGLQHRLLSGGSNSSSGTQPPLPTRSMSMREYVQYILYNDFNLVSSVSNRTTSDNGSERQNTPGSCVEVKAEIVMEWILS